MSLSIHYRTLLGLSTTAFNDLTADAEAMAEFTKSHNFAAEVESLHAAIATRPEASLLVLATREYQFSLYAAAIGSYRHAHISLRLFLELVLASIYFSAYEIRLRNWLAQTNDSDIKWSVLSDPENGVFSKGFLSAFHPGMESSGKQYLAIATTVYRECSEYVHGNMHTHTQTDHALKYDGETLRAWASRVDAIRLCVIFAYAGRYLSLLEAEGRNQLEGIMVGYLGHLPAIRQVYA
jgi:hypothetical protein